MCGRFVQADDGEVLQREFRLDQLPADYQPRYNVAPTDPVLSILRDGEADRAGWLKWGLVPHWAKDPGIGNRMINARSETAAKKPAFRDAFRHRRCLIPATGFYEWEKRPGGKIPHWIRREDGSPLALAGLWERWTPDVGDPVYTCTILTTDAGGVAAKVHPRMPVMLGREAREVWLDPDTEAADLEEVLSAEGEAERLTAHPVSTVVNSPRTEGPELIEEVPEG